MDMATMNCEKCNKALDYYIQVYNADPPIHPERWCLECVHENGNRDYLREKLRE